MRAICRLHLRLIITFLARPLQIVGGAVVSGSFQLYDQTYLISALEKLGPTYCGVTQLDSTKSILDDELLYLHSKGIRAIRFNVKRNITSSITEIQAMAERGWMAC